MTVELLLRAYQQYSFHSWFLPKSTKVSFLKGIPQWTVALNVNKFLLKPINSLAAFQQCINIKRKWIAHPFQFCCFFGDDQIKFLYQWSQMLFDNDLHIIQTHLLHIFQKLIKTKCNNEDDLGFCGRKNLRLCSGSSRGESKPERPGTLFR